MIRFSSACWGLLGAVAAVWVGCDSGDVGGDPGGTGASAAGPGGVGGAGGTGTGMSTASGGNPMPLFETDIVPIFDKSCGSTANACHSEVAYGAVQASACRGWLALKDVPLGSEFYSGPNDGQPTGCPDLALYERLIQLDAWQQCGDLLKRYVVPCDVDASYLFDKIDDGPYCSDTPGGEPSDPMPSGKTMDPGERETIRAWILAGAPRTNGDKFDCGGAGGAGGGATTGGGAQVPVPSINHPGDGETRKINVPIPFIGVATDPQDGDLSGGALVWTSSLDGPIGTGTMFDASLSTVGMHVITLTATDSNSNVGTDSLMLIMEP